MYYGNFSSALDYGWFWSLKASAYTDSSGYLSAVSINLRVQNSNLSMGSDSNRYMGESLRCLSLDS